jgi:hypothetical protein
MLGRWHWDNVLDGGLDLEGVDFETYGGGANMTAQHSPDPGFVELPYDAQIPVPFVWIEAGQQGCADHAGNFLLALALCGGITNELDYAVWALAPCPADECFDESDVIGYNVYDSLFDYGQTPVKTVDSPTSLYFMINEGFCSQRYIHVTALVEDQGQLRESYPGNQTFYNGNAQCAYLFGKESRSYRFTLDSVDFTGNIDDGADAEDDAEGGGFAQVRVASGQESAWWTFDEIVEFEDDSEDNPYFWKDFQLCRAEDEWPGCIPGDQASAQVGTFLNTTVLDLFYDDEVWVFIDLYDDDGDSYGESDDDLICNPFTKFDAVDVDNAPNQTLSVSIASDLPDADCAVTFHIELIQ